MYELYLLCNTKGDILKKFHAALFHTMKVYKDQRLYIRDSALSI